LRRFISNTPAEARMPAAGGSTGMAQCAALIAPYDAHTWARPETWKKVRTVKRRCRRQTLRHLDAIAEHIGAARNPDAAQHVGARIREMGRAPFGQEFRTTLVLPRSRSSDKL